jgi:hypothetical protein
MSRARAALAALALAATIAVAGCAAPEAGSAATLGDTRITEDELAAEVEGILAAQGLPLDTPDQALVSETLSRMVITELVGILADREGVEISQGRIDEQFLQYVSQAGDQASMEALFLQQNVAPESIPDVILVNLQIETLGTLIAPDAAFDEQGNAVFEAVAALSEELEVQTAPRFGTWDSATVSIGSAVDDLSLPPQP